MRPRTQQAISIRQPWAWAILTLGKDIENRSWRTRVRGRVYIHAGLGVTGRDVRAFLDTVEASPVLAARLAAAGGLDVAALRRQCGGIVGEATITDCVEASASPWFFGRYGFELADAKRLPFVACPGQLGFFDPFRPPAPGNRFTTRPPDLFTT